jgi:hypothetical protein
VAPISFTPRAWAWKYGLAPLKLGRKLWWMLIARPFSLAELRAQDLHVARQHHQVDALALDHRFDLLLLRALGGGIAAPVGSGRWWKGMP